MGCGYQSARQGVFAGRRSPDLLTFPWGCESPPPSSFRPPHTVGGSDLSPIRAFDGPSYLGPLLASPLVTELMTAG